jgi:uncharacterized membrane protein
MKHLPSHQEDQRMEVAMAMLLRTGVIAAALLVAVGGALVLRHPRSPVPNYTIFHSPGEHAAIPSANVAFHSISGVFRQIHTGNGASIIALGLLVLVATPVARVVFAVIGFTRERDWLYTVVSMIVLTILVYSFVHGR